MKSFLIACFLFLGLNVSAQNSNVNFDKRMDKMAKTYDLTSAQYASVKSLLEVKMKDMNGLKSEKISAEEHKTKLEAIELKYEASLLGILDDRQKKIYNIQKAMRQNAVGSSTNMK